MRDHYGRDLRLATDYDLYIQRSFEQLRAIRPLAMLTVVSAMGKSRSVTTVIAYLLATYPEHTPATALGLIRQARPNAEPNDGFMAQLELYHAMGCPENVDSQPRYQRWLYQREVELSIATGRAPENIRFEDEQVPESGAQEAVMELRCRKCR